MIGNGTSSALIGPNASIQWCCLPYFDSPSFFADILDSKRGGSFRIELENEISQSQAYLPKTNLLISTFKSKEGEFEIVDFMPRYRNEHNQIHCPPEIIRFFRLKSGAPKLKVVYDPRPNYGKGDVVRRTQHNYIKAHSSAGSYESIYLYSNLDYNTLLNSDSFVLEHNLYFVLGYHQKLNNFNVNSIELEMERTKLYWLNWVDRSHRFKQYSDEITRSSLILKMLCFEKTGAILAAATTSLPEYPGENRNWDYRFCWIRDASMTVRTLMRLGQLGTARDFLKFIINLIPIKDDQFQIMYGIHGQKNLEERELDWLDGYRNSKPVRVGNAAYVQKQNDIFGVLLDAIEQCLILFHTDRTTLEILWTTVRTIVRHVVEHWEQPDMGIWELRTQKKHFVFSKVLCWVALDRAVKIALKLKQNKLATEWSATRDQIKQDVMENGYDEKLNAFTQSYGEPYLDASNLLMEELGFIEASDPAYIGTVYQSYEKLMHDGLAYRYINADDFGKPRSSFTICTFWLIRSLYKIGEHDLARGLFDQVLQYANPVGLFSEDIDFNSKELLGNFPQAYSHLALIDTALVITEQDRPWFNPNENDHPLFIEI